MKEKKQEKTIEQLKQDKKKAALALGIAKLEWERRKYENGQTESEDQKEISDLQKQLKRKQLQYQMEKLKPSGDWPYCVTIVVLFILLILFSIYSQYILPTFSMFPTEYSQIAVNKIWANVFILFFKAGILGIILFFLYRISNKWLEKRD